jgi:hypothetical protein
MGDRADVAGLPEDSGARLHGLADEGGSGFVTKQTKECTQWQARGSCEGGARQERNGGPSRRKPGSSKVRRAAPLEDRRESPQHQREGRGIRLLKKRNDGEKSQRELREQHRQLRRCSGEDGFERGKSSFVVEADERQAGMKDMERALASL